MSHPRQLRAFAMLGASAIVLWSLLTPASAHIKRSDPRHNWNQHYRSLADKRFPTKTALQADDGVVNEVADPVHWTNLVGVPAGFADGADAEGGTASGLECTGCVGVSDLEFTYYTAAEADAAFASTGHDHDSSYYTKTQLDTSTPGSDRVHWDNLGGVPPDIADGDDAGQPAWLLAGNAGTTAGTDFLGTTDNVALEIKVNGARALRLEPASTPNVIGGLFQNTVTSGVFGATISGGGSSGGLLNRVTDDLGTIGGGQGNRAGDNDGTTSDRQYATVAGGQNNTASGNVSTVGGGGTNTASATLSTVSGGGGNSAGHQYATVSGGQQNQATGEQSTVAGGLLNTASGLRATVGGGNNHTASSTQATVAGGGTNSATAGQATVGGGSVNVASGVGATIPGGVDNNAGGLVSFAAGRRAKANHDGSFVWADFTNADFASSAADEFSIRASGGVRVFSKSDLTTGVTLAPNDGAWLSVSDRNVKVGFAAVDARSILRQVADMPITMWRYRGQDASIRHIGPVAQDFRAAFGVGIDDKHISTVDADGVALAAIQGLNDIVTEQQATIERLEARGPRSGLGIPVWTVLLSALGLLVLGAGLGLVGASALRRSGV